MYNPITSKGLRICDRLLNQIDYYEAILERENLIMREGEFRSYKLGLTLELLELVIIPDKLKSELISRIVEAWRLVITERTLEQREEELKMALRSLDSMRCAIKGTVLPHPGPMRELRLNVAIMSALPLMPFDFHSEGIPKIRNLISQVMDHLATNDERKQLHSSEKGFSTPMIW